MPTVSRRYATPDQRAFERPSGKVSPEAQGPVVLMVSGGADSCALLVLATSAELDIDDGRGLARIARERLHVLHVNHQLRGAASDEDERFVHSLCDELGVPCEVCRIDVAARAASHTTHDSNLENIGRVARYTAATELANKLCKEAHLPRASARIVTAHTASDRAETFFMNAIKGSGTQGLASIPQRRNRIVRPLLGYTHDELCDVLRMRGIIWREDETNADTHYLRAFVRHEVLPLVRQRNPRITETLSATCDILSDEDAYLTKLASEAFRALTRHSDDNLVVLDAARLAATEVVLARRIVRIAATSLCPEGRLESMHVARILELVARGKGKTMVSGGVEVEVAYGTLFMRAGLPHTEAPTSGWLEVPALDGVPGHSVELASPGPVGTLAWGSHLTLTARLREVAPGSDPEALARAHGTEWESSSILLDAASCGIASLGGRLWVESPQTGEVLCPLGMHGQSKKLSDLLIDEKMPAHERTLVPVIKTSPTGSVIWVAPIRADERARVTSASRVLLELHVVKGGY